MSRARNIKPGFFKNDVLAECQPLARILFAALWCEADREGRLEDRPKRLKAECLPYDDCDIEGLLGELETSGFILRYSIAECPYIQILAFNKHQNPHVREPASSIPAPVKHSASTVQAPNSTQPCTGSAGLIPDSPSLIPDSPSRKKKPLDHRADDRARVESDFDTKFWPAYPRKVGKANAEKAWRKIDPDPETVKDIVAAIAIQRESDQWCRDGGQFIPHPATWLNGRRWEDDEGRSASGHDLARLAI